MTAQKPHYQAESERIELLLNSHSDHPIYMLDPSGIIIDWNAGAEHLEGYAAHELVGL